MNTVQENPALREALGDAIRFEPVWWLNGDPYIKGGVSRPTHDIYCYVKRS